jgi:hypothetical protein
MAAIGVRIGQAALNGDGGASRLMWSGCSPAGGCRHLRGVTMLDEPDRVDAVISRCVDRTAAAALPKPAPRGASSSRAARDPPSADFSEFSFVFRREKEAPIPILGGWGTGVGIKRLWLPQEQVDHVRSM